MPSSLVPMLSSTLMWPGTLLVVIGATIYIRDMFRGQTRPDLVTWLLWTVAPLIAFFAQLQQGVGSPALLTLAVALCPAAVFLAGLWRAHYRITRFSLICGGMSVGALTSWQVTGNGNLAIVLSIAADALAALPTLVKSYRHPRSETPLFFAFFMAGSASTLLVIPHWTIESSAFAIYIFALYTLLYTLAQSRIGDRLRSRKSVPGRPKTDKLDSVWQAKLTGKGLLDRSFVPPAEIRQLRDYTRLRADLTHERTRYWQRLETVLEDALIKVSVVASALHTKSVRDMLEALIAGQRDPKVLAKLVRGRMKVKYTALVEALHGRFDDHHAELARMLLDQIDALGAQIDRLTTRIDELVAAIPAEQPPPAAQAPTARPVTRPVRRARATVAT